MNPIPVPLPQPNDETLIAEAAAAPTPRHAIAVLYPSWGLVADGGNTPGTHRYILHRTDQWVASTVMTLDFDGRDWADMSTFTRSNVISDTLKFRFAATGSADDLLRAIIAAANGLNEPVYTELGVAVLDLLDEPTRDSHLMLLGLAPADSMTFASALLWELRRAADTSTLPLYRHYTPGTDEPVTTEVAANTPTHTIHVRSRGTVSETWGPWTPGQPVHLDHAAAYLAANRIDRHRGVVEFELRDPDGNVLDETRTP